MTDYKKSTGSSATMMIRDTGSTVSFMINSNNSSTFVHELPWGYTINGATNNDRQYDYGAGDGWVTLASWTVSYDQTVTFRLLDTGTSGFGGPTTFSVDINRSSAPDAPVINSLTNGTTSVIVKTTDGNNGGDAIDFRQIIRNTSPTVSGGTTTTATGLTTTIGSLVPGTLYYFWARTHNGKGYSPWSPYKSITTLRGPSAPNSAIVSNPSQTSVLISFTDNSNGGTPITAREIGYGTSTVSGVQHSVSYSGVMTLGGLTPGTTYYFWTRVRNSVGWSAYSAPVSMRTIAGARVNINGVWKDAIPYVHAGGIWKIARPWGRVAGEWKEST